MESTQLVLAISKRVLVESLQGVFNDSGYLPHIEEISDMLKMKNYFSDVECPTLYQLPLYYGYVLHFKAPDDGGYHPFSINVTWCTELEYGR